MEKMFVATLSKRKILVTVFVCSFFVLSGFLFVLKPEFFYSILFRNSLIISLIGLIGMLFFGVILITILKKVVVDKSIGLEINKYGIVDKSSFVGVGMIPWGDILNIRKSSMSSVPFLLIDVSDPEKYISQGNWLKSKLLIANNKAYGTPISISANFIECSFQELEEKIMESYKQYSLIKNL